MSGWTFRKSGDRSRDLMVSKRENSFKNGWNAVSFTSKLPTEWSINAVTRGNILKSDEGKSQIQNPNCKLDGSNLRFRNFGFEISLRPISKSPHGSPQRRK